MANDLLYNVPQSGASTQPVATEQIPAGTGHHYQKVKIFDATTGSELGVTVAAFHNADNQALGGTAAGFNTGGVAQLLNAAGNLDRQREAGVDGAPAVGISTGAASFAMGFQTTDAVSNTTAGVGRVFTPGLMSGTINGVPWSIQVGSVLVVDSGANKETVVVTAVTATTFTATTTKSHNGTGTPFTVVGFVYNQERDAAGELDGATGSGTAVAAEYEYNGGAINGTANFDRQRNLQGKGLGQTTITSGGGAGSTSVVLAAAAGIMPGQQLLFVGGTAESVYVSQNYTVGSTTVPLQTALVNTHGNGSTVQWSMFSPTGPGTTGMIPDGEGAEGMLIFDVNSGLYFLVRSVGQDGLGPTNIPAEGLMLFNGATFDRIRSAGIGDAAATTGVLAAGAYGQTGTAQVSAARLPNVVKNIAAVAVTAGTPVAVWTPAAGKKFRVMGYALSTTVAGSVLLKDAATEVLRTPLLPAATPHTAPAMGNGILSSTANNVLNIDVTVTGNVSGYVFGIEE